VTPRESTWLRRRHPGAEIDWDFVLYWALTGAFVGVSVLVLKGQLETYWHRPEDLFSDAALYHAATRAWLDGADPWAVQVGDIRFAGLPTTLLLNLPLAPFDPSIAKAFWVVADVLGWLLVMRRQQLGPWWILFPPFIEGLFPASPDPALAALVVLSAGSIAVVTKPYSLPAVLAERRFLALASLVILPWAMYLDQLPAVLATLHAQSRDVTAWGDPVLMVLVVAALISLGLAQALRLIVPAIWPNAQLHYFVFSTEAAAGSAAFALALATPGLTAQLIVVIAAVRLVVRARSSHGRRGQVTLG
jgi:hypothetical protein